MSEIIDFNNNCVECGNIATPVEIEGIQGIILCPICNQVICANCFNYKDLDYYITDTPIHKHCLIYDKIFFGDLTND